MALPAGLRLGVYEVVSLIGTGGMGEVYRARDTRLRRDVAIKILPPLLSNDEERLARFEREAQALAALNHPHIAGIHGLEEHDSVRGLVMELVEGPTLAERVAGRPLPLAESLRYASQIASALDSAHEKGIVHRDLKPANVKLTPDDEVKVLDFGLAKAVDPGASRGDVSASPTLTARATQLGVILGTAAYMAPEQARGKAVDKRADIWSFGCVLFELVTGRRAFEGNEVTDVLARVIERDPDWSLLPASTPPAIRHLIERCLTKDPKARLRDIGEAHHTLEELRAGRSDVRTMASTPGSPPTGPAPPRAWIRLLPWGLAAAATAAAAVVFAVGGRIAAPASTQQIRVELVLPPDVEVFGSPSISADGTTVAFVGVREGVRQVYVRRLNSSATRAIPGTDGATSLAVGHDGRSGAMIATDTRVKRVAFDTGVVEQLTTGADILAGVELTGDGTIVFIKKGVLAVLTPGRAEARELVSLDTAGGEVTQAWPVVTPSGRHVIFSSRRGKPGQMRTRVEIVPIAGGTRRVLTESADLALVATPDRIVVAREGRLIAFDFNEDGALSGAGEGVQENVLVGATGQLAASVSNDGSMIFATGSLGIAHLVWVDSSGAERAVPGPARVYQNPRVSPDGRWIAYGSIGTVWSLDPVRGGVTRVSDDAGDGFVGFPTWLPDSARLFYRTRDGMVLRRADGEGAPKIVAGSASNDYPSAVTPDGKLLVFLRISAETAGDIYTVPVDGGEVKKVLATPAYEGAPQISPDGKWLAYVSNHSSQMEVYLRPFLGEDRRWPVSNGGGLHPLWSADGKRIFYRSGQKLLAVDVTTTPQVSLGAPVQILERRYEFGINLTFPNFSLSRDGKQFLVVKGETGGQHLSLIVNWLR